MGINPQSAPPHVFAVDERRLRYARLVRGQSGARCADLRERELAAGTFASGPLGGPLNEPSGFAAEIRALLAAGTEPGEPPVEIERASLVIPDRWLRMAFAELSDLPSTEAARDEVLLWKLRRLVPFRVEKLRVRGIEVAPLVSPSEPRRVLLGFAVDTLLSQLEMAFAEAGIRIGHISNVVLSLADAVVATREETGTLLISAQRDAYSLLVVAAKEPRLYRYKGLDADLEPAVAAPLIRRELLLTRSFLADQLPATPVERVIVATPAARQADWVGVLESTLDCTAEVLAPAHLGLSGGLPSATAAEELHDTAPLLGAAMREVA